MLDQYRCKAADPNTMADTPGRTRSVSCEYARLSPEVTLQYKSGFFAIDFLIRQMDSPSYRAHAHVNPLLGRSLSDTTKQEAQSARLCHHALNTQRNKNARSLIMNPTPTKRAGVTGPSQIDDEPGQRLAGSCWSLAHATYATNHTPGVA